MSELPLPPWKEPYRVDRWYCLDIEIHDAEGRLVRSGRVSWDIHVQSSPFSIDICYHDHHGLGLYCWPQFRVLSAAQDFVERLMRMSPEDAQKIHGGHWKGAIINSKGERE